MSASEPSPISAVLPMHSPRFALHPPRKRQLTREVLQLADRQMHYSNGVADDQVWARDCAPCGKMPAGKVTPGELVLLRSCPKVANNLPFRWEVGQV